MANKEAKIEILLGKIEEREKRQKNLLIVLTLIPIIVTIVAAIFINNKRQNLDRVHKQKVDSLNAKIELEHKETDRLRKEKVQLENEKKELKRDLQAFENVAFKYDDFKWNPEELTWLGPEELEDAEKANDTLMEILSRETTLEPYRDCIIRYYSKRIDSGRVYEAIWPTPFRDFKDRPANWYEGNPSNRVVADKSVDIKYIKMLAMALLRQGVRIKQIRYFYKEDAGKKNYMEISYDKGLEESKYLSFDDIINLKPEDL